MFVAACVCYIAGSHAAGAACGMMPIKRSSSATYSSGYCLKCATCAEPANILDDTSTPLASCTRKHHSERKQ